MSRSNGATIVTCVGPVDDGCCEGHGQCDRAAVYSVPVAGMMFRAKTKACCGFHLAKWKRAHPALARRLDDLDIEPLGGYLPDNPILDISLPPQRKDIGDKRARRMGIDDLGRVHYWHYDSGRVTAWRLNQDMEVIDCEHADHELLSDYLNEVERVVGWHDVDQSIRRRHQQERRARGTARESNDNRSQRHDRDGMEESS